MYHFPWKYIFHSECTDSIFFTFYWNQKKHKYKLVVIHGTEILTQITLKIMIKKKSFKHVITATINTFIAINQKEKVLKTHTEDYIVFSVFLVIRPSDSWHLCSSLRFHQVDIISSKWHLLFILLQTKVLVCLIDRWDDQGDRVYTLIIKETWVEEWIERLTKGATRSRVDMNPGFHIIEGDFCNFKPTEWVGSAFHPGSVAKQVTNHSTLTLWRRFSWIKLQSYHRTRQLESFLPVLSGKPNEFQDNNNRTFSFLLSFCVRWLYDVIM